MLSMIGTFSPRFYFLVDASFDHNYSQGLDLQQIYGGGAGYTVIKRPKQELDVKFDIHYERQQYFVTPNIVPPPPLTPSKNLIGADFGDTYMLKLAHGLVFNQGAVITPAFNQSKPIRRWPRRVWCSRCTSGSALPWERWTTS